MADNTYHVHLEDGTDWDVHSNVALSDYDTYQAAKALQKQFKSQPKAKPAKPNLAMLGPNTRPGAHGPNYTPPSSLAEDQALAKKYGGEAWTGQPLTAKQFTDSENRKMAATKDTITEGYKKVVSHLPLDPVTKYLGGHVAGAVADVINTPKDIAADADVVAGKTGVMGPEFKKTSWKDVAGAAANVVLKTGMMYEPAVSAVESKAIKPVVQAAAKTKAAKVVIDAGKALLEKTGLGKEMPHAIPEQSPAGIPVQPEAAGSQEVRGGNPEGGVQETPTPQTTQVQEAQPGGDVRSPDVQAPQTKEVTGLANVIQKQMADSGQITLPEKATPQSPAEHMSIGRQQVESGTVDPEALARKVGTGGVAFNADDVGALHEGNRLIQQDVNKAAQAFDEAKKSGDLEAEASAKAEWEFQRSRQKEYLDNVQKGKGEWAHVGHALQQLTDVNTGDITDVITHFERNKPVGQLASDQEIKDLTDMVNSRNQAVSDIATHQITRIEQTAKTFTKGSFTKEAIIAERQQLLNELKTKFKDIHSAHSIGNVAYHAVDMGYTAGKLAINYMKDGVVSLEEIVKNVVKDMGDHGVDVSREDVLKDIDDLTTNPSKKQSELQKQIAKLKRTAKMYNRAIESGASKPTKEAVSIEASKKRLAELTDQINTGNFPDEKSKRAASQELTDLRKQVTKAAQQKKYIKEGASRPTKEAQDWNRLQQQVAWKQYQLDNNLFGDTGKAAAPKRSPEFEKAVGVRDAMEKQIRHKIEEQRQKTVAEHVARYLSENVISGLGFAAKIATEGTTRLALDPIESLMTPALRAIKVGGKSIAEQAPSEASTLGQFGGRIKGTLKSPGEVWKYLTKGTNTAYDAAGTLGKSDIGFGRLHGALQSIFMQGDFEGAIANEMRQAAREGKNINDPEIISAMRKRAGDLAIERAMRNPNITGEVSNNIRRMLTSKDPKKQAMGLALHTLAPIRNLPANYLAKTVDYMGGAPLRAAGGLIGGAKKGGFTEQEAASVAQAIKRSLPAAAAVSIGLMNPKWFKSAGLGRYKKGQEIIGDDGTPLKPGEVEIFGHRIKGHAPILNAVATVASMRDLKAGKTTWQAVMQGIGREIPGIPAITALGEGNTKSIVGEITPGGTLIRGVSEKMDPDGKGGFVQRIADGPIQQLQSMTPGLRNQLPAKNWIYDMAKSQSDPVVQEFIKNDLSLGRPTQRPGEKPDEYQARIKSWGADIVDRLNAVVRDPSWDSYDKIQKNYLLSKIVNKFRGQLGKPYSGPEHGAKMERIWGPQ